MKKIVLFAGAGASKAVNPGSYPSTLEFFERLPKSITEDEFFTLTLEFIRRELGNGVPIDIEVILWRLADLEENLLSLSDTNRLLGWFLDGSRLLRPFHRTTDFGNVREAAKSAQPRIAKLISGINQQVYDLYSRLPERSELQNNWIPLLEGLVSLDGQLELFTTNYDLILETALDELGGAKGLIADTGWKGSILRWLQEDLWADPSSDGGKQPGQGLLTKLHGSVNWTRSNGRIYVGDPTYKGSHERHAIIYPGFKRRPTQEPFIAFHQHFSRALLRADVAVFIGFAFRDEHINDLCERFLNPEARVFVINPADFESPFDKRRIEHLRQGFTADSVHQLLLAMEEASPHRPHLSD